MSDAASNPQLTYLSALIEWAKHQDKKGSVRLLQQTVELHLEQLDGCVPLPSPDTGRDRWLAARGCTAS
eukprot:COSAG01_NODE_8054_length_2918_cov_9.946089_2_plen_69_part_00